MQPVPEPSSEARERCDDAGQALVRDGAIPVPLSTPANEMLTSLLSSARHELRSPLQSIQGFAELLESEVYGGLSEQQHAFVGHILQGSVELSSMLEACLELTELEVRRRPLELMSTPLQSAVDQALTQAAKKCDAKLERSYGPELDSVYAKLDVNAFGRALSALLTALSAGSPRSFSVQLELEAERAWLRVARASAVRGSARPLEELAQQRPTCRSLVWLRLASVLLDKQSASLLLSEHVDRAEICLRLSPTH